MYRRIKVHGHYDRGGTWSALGNAMLFIEENVADYPSWMKDWDWDGLWSLGSFGKGKYYWTEAGWQKYGRKTMKVLNFARKHGFWAKPQVIKVKEKDADVHRGDKWQVVLKTKKRIRDRRMNKEKVAVELARVAKDLMAAQVMDVEKYMSWASDDLNPLKLAIHSLGSRVSNATDATLDPKVSGKIGSLAKEVARLEKQRQAVERAIGEVVKAAKRA